MNVIFKILENPDINLFFLCNAKSKHKQTNKRNSIDKGPKEFEYDFRTILGEKKEKIKILKRKQTTKKTQTKLYVNKNGEINSNEKFIAFIFLKKQ